MMTKVLLPLGMILNVAAFVYGIYNEFTPKTWGFHTLPEGFGQVLALVGATMGLTLKVVQEERSERHSAMKQERQDERGRSEAFATLAEHVSTCVPSHEREFYAVWSAQVGMASSNVDVTP